MSIWSRLFGRRALDDYGDLSPDTLLEDPRRSATRLGTEPLVMPWSAGRLLGIFEELERYPGQRSLGEARLARQCLSQFWLSAPVDYLQFLYESEIGSCYRRLLAGPLTREPLLDEELAWRDTLKHRLSGSFERQETINVLIAVMPYFAPGTMRVADPLRQIPAWLQEDYGRLFDPVLLQSIGRPMGLLNPVGQAYGPSPSLGLQGQVREPLAPVGRAAAGPTAVEALPQLAALRGQALLQLLQTPEHQRRMNGLINLFVIDPSDVSVQRELSSLRRHLGQLWLDARREDLEQIYASSIGRMYRDLVACGYSKAPLAQEDRLLRNRLARVVADMSQPGALNALLAALPYYPPGRIQYGGGQSFIPAWLGREMATIYGDVPAQAAASMNAPASA